jgi:hypothetical protein
LGNLASQFRDLDALEDHLNALLATLIPKGLGKRRRRVAVDLVALPSHGTLDEAHQGEVYRSKANGFALSAGLARNLPERRAA